VLDGGSSISRILNHTATGGTDSFALCFPVVREDNGAPLHESINHKGARMLIKHHFTAVAFLIIALFLSPIPITAQSGSGDWSRVTALSPGTKISLKLKNGKSVKGYLSSASESSISINTKNGQDIKKDDVQSVYVVSDKSAAKAALIGLSVGAGAGAVVGGIGASNDDYFDSLDSAVVAGLTVVGAGVGALTGFLIGKTGNKKRLIYQAR